MSTKIDLLVSSTDETGETHKVPLSRQQAVGQISITGTQTVTLQGRLSDDHDWLPIKQATVSTHFLFTMAPQLRVVTTGTSGGSSITSAVY